MDALGAKRLGLRPGDQMEDLQLPVGDNSPHGDDESHSPEGRHRVALLTGPENFGEAQPAGKHRGKNQTQKRRRHQAAQYQHQ